MRMVVWMVEVRQRRQGVLGWRRWLYHATYLDFGVAKRVALRISRPLGRSEFQARVVPFDRRGKR